MKRPTAKSSCDVFSDFRVNANPLKWILSAGTSRANDMPDKVADLLAFIDRNIGRTLSSCTGCGRCHDACPMPPYSDALTGHNSRRVVAGVLDILRGEKGSAEALEWTRVCAQSSTCDHACPENVNPMMMLRLSRIVALGSTGGPAQLPITRTIRSSFH